MKEEGKNDKFLSLFVAILMMITGAIVIGNLCVGDLPYDDIEQDSNGNYHKVFIDNSTGDYEIFYTNDIGGDFSQDWNPPIKLKSSNNELLILDFDIYLSIDMIFFKWSENKQEGIIIYYMSSEDYGSNWKGPYRYIENEMIALKYAIFDPVRGEPYIPNHLKVHDTMDTYEYYIVQHSAQSAQIIHDDIRALGGIFCGYAHYKSYIIWMNETIKQEVEQLSYIRWVGFYHPAYKIHSGLLDTDGIIELNVIVFEETGGQENLDKVNQEIEALGGYIIYNGSSNYIVRTRTNAEKIDDIAFIQEVEWIDEIGEWWPGDPIPLHHIDIIDDGPHSFNISDTHNFTSVGWDDELEDDLNRSWQPVWSVEGGIGEIIGDGYTITFKATKPGDGKLICTDENTGMSASLEIHVEREIGKTSEEFPWIWVLFVIILIVISVIGIIAYKKRNKLEENGDS